MKSSINLAGRPLRNRRFFRAALGALIVLALLSGWLGLGSIIRYKTRQSRALDEYDRLDAVIQKAESTRNAESVELKERTRTFKDLIELTNGAIMKKAFGWVEFFTLLESALPASSYISSMAPVAVVGGKFEVKFKVVSRNMDDLLLLTRNLMSATGSTPFVLSEMRLGGQLVAEITLTYEKSH